MADDRSTSDEFISKEMGHASLTSPTSSTISQNSPSKGPRTLLLRRGDNGFGFTLRHFIVYPPESCCALPGHDRTRIDEPMDTIFVKQVRKNSTAAAAGLKTGDRVVSVDGVPTRGEQYSSVIQRIQRTGPWLRLLVVSKEDDILQRYFGETAHNPETNRRLARLCSPELFLQKQRRSMSMITGSSPRSSSSSGTQHLDTDDAHRLREESFKDQTTMKIASAPNVQRRPLTETWNQGPLYRETRRPQRRSLPQVVALSGTGFFSSSTNRHLELCDRRRPESISSQPSSERIYDHIKDPIYEFVRPELYAGFSKSSDQQYPVSPAEPQVPIYYPSKTVITMNANEGRHTLQNNFDNTIVQASLSPQLPPSSSLPSSSSSSSPSSSSSSSSQSSSLSPQAISTITTSTTTTTWTTTKTNRTVDTEPPKDSPLESKDGHISSFDLKSILMTDECSDDSVMMTRLRKSFEQKEEFLRRPSHPIGWLLPDDNNTKIQVQPNIIQKEFYGRPQKLRRQVWPPNELLNKASTLERIQHNLPLNQCSQEVSCDDICSDKPEEVQSCNTYVVADVQTMRDRFYSSFHNKNRQFFEDNYFSYGKNTDIQPASSNDYQLADNNTNNNDYYTNNIRSKASATTLSRINGTVPIQQETQNIMTETLSLPSSPRSVLKTDKFPVPAKGLQIVSKRTKQFETGKLLNNTNQPTSDRTDLYKSELSRLSNKRSVPNVAVRKREFESKVRWKDIQRFVVTRGSKSSDSSETSTMDAKLGKIQTGSNSAISWKPRNDEKNQRGMKQIELDGKEDRIRNVKAIQPDCHSQDIKSQHASDSDATSTNTVVLRRQKNSQISDEDRATRRVSYLKATWGERMHVDSDLELSDSEPLTQTLRSSSGNSDVDVETSEDIESVEREGTLYVKFTVLDGKRSTDRSWKQFWGVLRGPILHFYKDRHSQTLPITSDSDMGQNMDVRSSLVDVAEDYTKRKHVLRIANPTVEILLQPEDGASMALWLRSLHKHAAAEKSTEINLSTTKQQAVPQAPGPTTPNAGLIGQRLSPLPSHKGIRKLTSFRTRSPTVQSHVDKTRKPSQTTEPLLSPKSKTWKGRVAKQLRRMHGQAGSPSSTTAQLPIEGATFKVPLELCPMSSFSEFVPLIVEMCTSIVEARGLEVIGIYRVPGNTASISQLTESVNKGFENINLQDPRWSDVNVISSLLKSFFRHLPDSLFTADLYPMFIDADKIEDPQRRMATIRKLLHDLPEHHFETLKHLMFHLGRVIDHSQINKMEAKNLAIVFGPTLVRTSGSRDNMVTMVTDMSHQCRIIESLLNNVDWFFCEEDLDDLSGLSVNLSIPADGSDVDTSNTNHSLLLNNIQKIEGMREIVSAKDIVSSIISAANRKIQRRKKGQDEHEYDDHGEDKIKTNNESKSFGTIRQSMALSERQCSVSEIVSMHENKNHLNVPLEHKDRSQIMNCSLNGPLNSSTASNCCKYSHIQQSQVQQFPTTLFSHDSSKLTSKARTHSQDTVSSELNLSNEIKQSSNDEIAIRTYAGLSATTQERIRRFEQETKAMLQRDQHKQKREAEKRDEERRAIEISWQSAKHEMENDDIRDTTVYNPVDGTSYSSNRICDHNCGNDYNGDRHRSKSTIRITPLSIAVQQQPSANQRALLTCDFGNTNNRNFIKKFKIDNELSMESATPTRYGSLDSLHEVHTRYTPPSPSHQFQSDISDDGSDLLISLTSTFDQKWKSLINQSRIILGNTNGNINVLDEKKQIHYESDNSISKVFRDPSLHRSVGEIPNQNNQRNDPSEKQKPSSIKKSLEKSTATATPDNDRNIQRRIIESNTITTDSSDCGSILDATEKDENPVTAKTIKLKHLKNNNRDDTASMSTNIINNITEKQKTANERKIHCTSYRNELEKFENLSKATNESSSRLKRSESLNKKSEINSSKLKRSESLNKHSDRLISPINSKLKRSESLNKHPDKFESSNIKLKRSESLTKTEKTECNISKRRQSVRKENSTKLKRKNGMPERSIKRRHTVGGTKDFDKVHWLDNKLPSDEKKVIESDNENYRRSQLRTSSPDLSSTCVSVSDTSFRIEVSFRGPSNVVFNVTNTRPQSLPNGNLASKSFQEPLESHV